MNALDYNLTTSSIILGVVFGIFTPLFANYLPIKASMSNNLRNSLDLSRNNADDGIGIKIEKLEEVGMSFNQLGMGVLLVVIGTVTYYGVPLSFLNENLFVAFVILSLILIMVILGLTFMCTLIFNHVESLLLTILLYSCCRRDLRIKQIITKQMNAHQVRNNKTSIMFTLSVAFLFFASSSFELINTLVLKGFDKIIGADLYVSG